MIHVPEYQKYEIRGRLECAGKADISQMCLKYNGSTTCKALKMSLKGQHTKNILLPALLKQESEKFSPFFTRSGLQHEPLAPEEASKAVKAPCSPVQAQHRAKRKNMIGIGSRAAPASPFSQESSEKTCYLFSIFCFCKLREVKLAKRSVTSSTCGRNNVTH